jgi:hypothetical protein
MIQKEYGKFTLEQFENITNRLREANKLSQSFEPLMQEAGLEKLKEILTDNFSWCSFYELPFEQHMAATVLIFGWMDEVKLAAQADDPQQYFLDFIDSLDPEADWDGGYQGLFEKKHLVGAVISIFKTIKSFMVNQKSLSRLVEEVRVGNDKSLFDAVRIDRSMVGCPSIAHRISLAELQGDKKFFLHLKKALKGPSQKQWVGLDELRYMMQAFAEIGPERVSDQTLEDVFVQRTKLYPKSPSAQKNLRKHYLHSKKINSRK